MRKTNLLLGGCMAIGIVLAAIASEPEPLDGGVDTGLPCAPPRSCRRPCGWCPTSLGAAMRANIDTQIDNGTAAGMVLYRCDFCDPCSGAGNKLSPNGHRWPARMAGLMEYCGFYPLTIEATGRRELDSARRNYVLNTLGNLGFAGSADWVVIGRPEFPMLSGEEAVRVYNSMLQEARVPTTVAGQSTEPALTPIAPAATVR